MAPETEPRVIPIGPAIAPTEAPTWLPTEGRRTVLATAHDKPLPVAERDGVVLPALGWAVLGA